MMQDESDWTDDERRALEAFGDDVSPAGELRDRTLRAVRENGVGVVQRRSADGLRPLLGLAAALAIAAGVVSYVSLRSESSGSDGRVVDSTTSMSKPAAKVERHVIWY